MLPFYGGFALRGIMVRQLHNYCGVVQENQKFHKKGYKAVRYFLSV